MATTRFDWDTDKDAENQLKHGVLFSRAQHAFADLQRVDCQGHLAQRKGNL
jgi:uncharacterized DUF497 family protein